MSPHAGERDERPVDVAEEVSRLAEAVQAWWSSAHVPSHPPQDHHQQADHQQPDHQQAHHHAGPHREPEQGGPAEPRDEHLSSCRICPLCRALDLVRAVRPEVLQQVATAAETVAVLLREAAGDRDRNCADRPPAPDVGEGSATTTGDRHDDLPAPFFQGTSIVVTDGGDPASGDDQDDGDEGGRTAWA